MVHCEFATDENIHMCVYKITHKNSGRVYIGQTIRKAVKRWRDYLYKSKSGNSHIGSAIRKHGKTSFIFEVIDIAETRAELNHKEIFWISHYNSMTPNGYNLVSGGTMGKVYSEESKAKMSNSRRKNPSSPRKGVPNSVETRLKISMSNTGKKSLRRVVITRNDGKIYESILEAANELGVSAGNVGRQIREPDRTVVGFQFKKGIHSPWDILKQSKKTAVIRSDGIIFKTIEDAAQSISAHVASVQSVISGKRNSCFGFTFRRL